jgi:hypothetical protein
VDVIVCARCSSPVSRGDQFCPRCGAKISLIEAPAPEAAASGKIPGAPQSAAPSTGQVIAERLASLSSEPRNKLVALALTGLGGALAVISFFLPWANEAGLAIGSMGTGGSQPQPGAWAFDTPAGWPLLLITLLLLACVVAGGRAQELMPGLASTIRPLTEIVAPLALGSALLGVVLLYVTLPWGHGGGLIVLAVGGCLLIAGSMAALFFPSAPEGEDRS